MNHDNATRFFFLSQKHKKLLKKHYPDPIPDDVFFLIKEVFHKISYRANETKLTNRQLYCLQRASDILNRIGFENKIIWDTGKRNGHISYRYSAKRIAYNCWKKIDKEYREKRLSREQSKIAKREKAEITVSEIKEVNIDMEFLQQVKLYNDPCSLPLKLNYSLRDRHYLRIDAINGLYKRSGMKMPNHIDTFAAWKTLCDKAKETWLWEVMFREETN